MSLESLLTLTATITHRAPTGAVDRYNVPEWTETITPNVPCYREEVSASEETTGRNTEGATHRAMFGPNVILDGSDLVTIDGVTYEVVGVPSKAWNPRTAQMHHIEADLKELSE